MNPVDQIPAMDIAIAKMDQRINRAYATIGKLEYRSRELLKRVERVRRYARELGAARSRIATFQLDL